MQWKEISARIRGDVVVIDLAGNMCLCGENELRDFVVHLLDQGSRQFVLNLLRTPSIDSSGLGGMVQAYSAVARKGGKLKLLHVHPRIRQLLDTTRVASIFEMFTSEDEAVSSFTEHG